jgi:hypothetical protein
MFVDAAWARLARSDEMMCAPCAFGAAVNAKISLTLADLLPCAFNLFHSPRSWFDLFLSREGGTPPNLQEWRAAEIAARIPSSVWLDEQEALRAAGQLSFDDLWLDE